MTLILSRIYFWGLMLRKTHISLNYYIQNFLIGIIRDEIGNAMCILFTFDRIVIFDSSINRLLMSSEFVSLSEEL